MINDSKVTDETSPFLSPTFQLWTCKVARLQLVMGCQDPQRRSVSPEMERFIRRLHESWNHYQREHLLDEMQTLDCFIIFLYLVLIALS